MASRTTGPRSNPVRVVFATTALLSVMSSWRASALAMAELGAFAFFASGVAEHALGPSGAWFVLLAVLAGVALRAVDLEGCGLLVPGGLYGLVRGAFGKPAARAAASAELVDHLLLGALAAMVAGHYLASVGHASLAARIPGTVTIDDLSSALAVVIIGAVWWWHRQGRVVPVSLVPRAAGAVVGLLVLVIAGAFATAAATHRLALPMLLPDAVRLPSFVLGHLNVLPRPVVSVVIAITAFGSCLFAIGSGEALAHVAPELRQPRMVQLRRTALLVCLYSVAITAVAGFLATMIVPPDLRADWLDVPLAALALSLGGPGVIRAVAVILVVVGALALLTTTVHRTATGAQRLLSRLTDDGVLAKPLGAMHPRYGTPWRLIDLLVVAQLVIVVMSAGQISWLARAYGIAVVVGALLKIAALIRFRALRPGPPVFRVPGNLRISAREWPVGLVCVAAPLAVAALLVLGTGDPASLGGAGLVVALGLVFSATERAVETSGANAAVGFEEFQVLPAADIALPQVEASPGNILVPVRRPLFLAHLAEALQTAGDRDIVVMTARIQGVDATGESATTLEPTDEERRLFSTALAMAERYGHAVRLLIVPAADVLEAIVGTAVRLRSSDIYVGESETLSAEDQARLLGEAWEHVPASERPDTRLVIHHRSGRAAVYYLGAHAPTLSPEDLHLIHSHWLDLAKTVGSHLHHHDVVRAALKLMEEQLNGPNRDVAVDMVRQVARPAEELAAVVRARDFTRLRDMVRNRSASDLARVLTDLAAEDQVVAFRVLPRKVAASTFEYLTLEAQEALLKAMAQEDVAGLLNNMAPDDRTMFLEELPAEVTRQLLALLTPDERSVAVTLLGYPEDSIGRLMTPDYVAVREHWTVQEVLDYVRTHGQDSETLNVIYVVDDAGQLIDDIRIREFLLTAPQNKVSDLMDRRFVALKATDDEETAVKAFRREDRSALPVTDSAGVLIGIVTIDDVLHVVEDAATKEMQRVGGSEALDEPYTTIAFTKMFRKRAGWLTALFLGEMLTATAMAHYQDEVTKAVVLALFLPLIISSGGNSGSQGSTLIIRAMALGELQLKDWWRVMRREFASGLSLGTLLGIVGFCRIVLWQAIDPRFYGAHWLLIASTVGMALVGVVLWGTLVGSLLPFALRRLGFDPATSSAPLVATMVDVTGLIIYFSVARVMFSGTLL